MTAVLLCFDIAVDHAAATVFQIVAVDEFAVRSALRNAHAKIMPDDRRKVRDTNHEVTGCVTTQPNQHTVVAVVPGDPLEAGVVVVARCGGPCASSAQVDPRALVLHVRSRAVFAERNLVRRNRVRCDGATAFSAASVRRHEPHGAQWRPRTSAKNGKVTVKTAST